MSNIVDLVPLMQRWGWPPKSLKPHYFIDGESLCGKIRGYHSSMRSWTAPDPDRACQVCGRKLGRWLASAASEQETSE